MYLTCSVGLSFEIILALTGDSPCHARTSVFADDIYKQFPRTFTSTNSKKRVVLEKRSARQEMSCIL